MCGIAGWYRRDGLPVTRDLIARQCRSLRHRGPDDEGILVDGDFGFGMRRLSIVDIAGGHQPMTTDDGRYSIVFNGEIYNHSRLRTELANLGHGFRTRSDTEVALIAFCQWGGEAWAKLDGMFAIAIWDHGSRELTLARDPLGIKPLYVTEQQGGLAFGSELGALLELRDLRFDVSPRAVQDYLAFGHVSSARSIYTGIRQLTPGTAVVLGPAGSAREQIFWRPAFRDEAGRDEAAWVEEFRQLWLRTVEQHLQGDVAVGAFLSGGIDSSAVVAAMTKVTGSPVKTFTIGFPVERYNEAPVAEAVARHLGCDHTTRMIDLKTARTIIPEVQDAYDEPFGHPSAIPTWYVSKVAREQVKVVLSGDGGDELFFGYKRHLTEHRLGSLSPVARQLARAAADLPRTPWRRVNRAMRKWDVIGRSAALPDGMARYFAKMQVTTPELRRQLLDPGIWQAGDVPQTPEAWRDEAFPSGSPVPSNPLRQFALCDLTHNLPDGILTKVDRASMAHSLEVRVPLLSPRLADWAMAVPDKLKIRRGTPKYLLRAAIAPWVPAGVSSRRKQGFQVPVAEWFDGGLGGFARELWHDTGLRRAGIFRASAIDGLIDAHQAGTRDHGRTLYALTALCLWWQRPGNRHMA